MWNACRECPFGTHSQPDGGFWPRSSQGSSVAPTLRLQQRKVDRFRPMFNHERPHQGLNNRTPGRLYQPCSVICPRTLIEFVYPNGFMTRSVNHSGDISWYRDRVFISEVFRFEDLGSEMVGEDSSIGSSSAISRWQSLLSKPYGSGPCRSRADRQSLCFFPSVRHPWAIVVPKSRLFRHLAI
jgi:hypothetical protein